ncbi:hypothetical protein I2I05_03065 [Hymenobacter sp. BT683]|uniref:VPDSG-CTERM sorting domain-containing protein n=1 Tax=Hymenobacter jeongseonensis TaxID=2791027 RepID=A0ABS0IDD7_9BACT|nr:hypothetical protein [Hymenobacter jeongseonensis]MBF9236366.1 hypothetical protein [Hymenobacter jeongseonensis]
MKSFLLKKLLPSLLMVAATTVFAFAQGSSDDPDTGGPVPAPVNVPIDGGVSLLLAGGVAFGVKQLRNRRRKA